MDKEKNIWQQNAKNSQELPYSSEIVKAFQSHMNGVDKSYFSKKMKSTIVKDFWDFVEDEYDANIFKALKEWKVNGQSLDVELNTIVDKWFTLSDLKDKEKGTIIKKNLWTMTSEWDAIKKSLISLAKERQQQPESLKQSIDFDEYMRTIGYSLVTDQEWRIVDVKAWPKSEWQSLASMKRLWSSTINSKVHNTEAFSELNTMFSTDHYDPTEKVACITAVRELHDKIDRLGNKNIMNHFQNEFWSDVYSRIIGQWSWWTTLEQLWQKLEDFFTLLATNKLVDEKILHQLQSVSITPRWCTKVGEQTGDLPVGVYDEQIKNKRFSELQWHLQHLVGGLVQTNLINNVANTVDSLETPLENYAKVVDIPGNLHDFFKNFGKPSDYEMDVGSPEYQKDQLAYQKAQKEYNDFIRKNESSIDPLVEQEKKQLEQKMNDLLSRINPHHSYLWSKQRLESLKDSYAEAKSDQDKERLKEEIQQLEQQISDKKNEPLQINSWENYFSHIGQQVDDAVSQIGKINITGHQVYTVLKKLQSQNRNVSILSPQEKNILLKASLAQQLAQVKQSKITEVVWYGFEDYAQFLIGLYDLESKQSIITTKDGKQISLDFESKNIVGKPLEWHNIDVKDIEKLKNIRLEFELNLDGNSDAENFIRMMTGWPLSQIIEDFLPLAGNKFPHVKTITDSTKVKMIDKDGKEFEWYLSRYEYPDDDTERPEGSDHHAEQNTYVLYSEPADRYSTTRQIKPRRKNEQWKDIPVYINMDNLDDWKDIQIVKKNVTLSDNHIKALSLWHMVAQQTDKSDLIDLDKYSELKTVNKLSDTTMQKHLDETSAEYRVIEEDLNADERFTYQWNTLVGNEKIVCEEGVRFALAPKVGSAIPSVPQWKDLISWTVKNVKKDKDGKILSFDMHFDTLSRNGPCTIKDVMITADNIAKLKELFDVTYLDNKSHNKEDYKSVATNLSWKFSERKDFNGFIFNELNFDGKQFIKNNEPVTKFVIHEATTDADNKDKKKYDIEYTIERIWSRYRVMSTGFEAAVPEGSWDKKTTVKKNIRFDTTTDLTGVLLILWSRKLVPYTEKEYKNYKQWHPSDGIIPEKRYTDRSLWSLRTVFSVLKWGGKKIADQWLKKLDETGKDELQYVLFQEKNVYRKLHNMFGGALEFFDMDIFEDLAEESEAESMNYGFKKIETYFKHLQNFHHSFNIWWSIKAGTDIQGANNMVKRDIDKALKYYTAGRTIPYKSRYKVAAGLWYMLDKYKAWYAKLLSTYPRGTFVKILFWEQAYNRFKTMYEQEERNLLNADRGKHRNKIQHQLMLFEYNFVSHNIAGWPRQDLDFTRDLWWWPNTMANQNAWYFHHLYSRKYGGELRKTIANVWNISTDIDDADVKAQIDGGTFLHLKLEYYNHIKVFRMKDAIEELIAMQQKASTPAEADEVGVAIMTGLLNGAFVHHLSRKTRDDLRRVCRNSWFPLTPWMEYFDAPTRVASLLEMITANDGDNSFKKKFNYLQSDIDPFTYKALDDKWSSKVKQITDKFKGWMEWASTRKKVLDFLHMSNIEQSGNDNMMYIWNYQPPEDQPNKRPIIAWHEISKEQQDNVVDIMREFYFNTDRGADVKNYNYEPWFERPRTMIEQANKSIFNKSDGHGWFEQGIWDHAEVYYSSIIKNAPDKNILHINRDNQYKLRFFVDEFFRVFSGWGELDYTREDIQRFYTYVRKAQDQTNKRDQRRLIRFPIIEKMYSKWPIPPLVEEALTKYMTFFESNLSMFDKNLGKMHHVPKALGDDFEYAFTQDISDYVYYPEHERKQIWDATKRMTEYRKYANDNITIINGEIQEKSKTAKWNAKWYNSRSIGMTYDKKIEKLSGWIFWSSALTKKVINSNIDVTNNADVDMSSLSTPSQGRDYQKEIMKEITRKKDGTETAEEKMREIAREQTELAREAA